MDSRQAFFDKKLFHVTQNQNCVVKLSPLNAQKKNLTQRGYFLSNLSFCEIWVSRSDKNCSYYYCKFATSVTSDIQFFGLYRHFGGQKLVVQKIILYLLGGIILIKIWEENDFLSDHILASEWPCFAVPIHMCHPVYIYINRHLLLLEKTRFKKVW